MRLLFTLLTLSTLAACGADGEPTAPGVRVSGTTAVGVTMVN